MARSMLSLGMFSPLAARMAVRRRGLVSGSAPPVRAAIVSSRIILVKILPRLASVAAFLCLIVAHFECPDMVNLLREVWQEQQYSSCRDSVAVAPHSGNRAAPHAPHGYVTARSFLDTSPAALRYPFRCKSAHLQVFERAIRRNHRGAGPWRCAE